MKPYPAAIDDSYDAFVYLKEHAENYGYKKNQLMVGGESAGGGLCAAHFGYAASTYYADNP